MKQNISTILFYLSILFLVVLGTAALAAPTIAPYDPVEQYLDARFSPPTRSHLLGTEHLGREVFCVCIYDCRAALSGGLVAGAVGVR